MKYSASFTIGSLYLDETVRVIKYILANELDQKKSEIIEGNVIKLNSELTRKKVLQEIKKRVKSVDRSVWTTFEKTSTNGRKILLFYSVIKTYPLLNDFMKEVIVNKWKSLKFDFNKREIEIFLDKKSAEQPEIEKWSITTKAKIIEIIKRMLKECGLLVNNKLNAFDAPDYFWKLFIQVGDPWFLEFALLNKEQRERIIGRL